MLVAAAILKTKKNDMKSRKLYFSERKRMRCGMFTQPLLKSDIFISFVIDVVMIYLITLMLP